MSNVKDMMIRKPSLKYRDVREYEGKYYDWEAGEHLLKKGTVVDEVFHPLEHDIRFIKDEQVPMRDGVKILTDVYLPVSGSEVASLSGLEVTSPQNLKTSEPQNQYPAIIAWSPYGKNSGNADRFKNLFGLLGLDQKRMSGLQKFEGPDPDYWCAQGYAIVYPDPRGIGRSEGDSTMLGTQEGQDGADLVEWVARQPWCNGKVAMSGTSYLSFSQWFIAAERPEHLVCTQVTEALTDGYRDMCLVGGMPDYVFTEGIQNNHEGFGQREDVAEESRQYPFANHPLWQDKIARVWDIEIPILVVASYSNVLHTDGTFRAWRQLGSKEKWLRIHDNLEWQDYYEPKYVEERLRFFDYYMKGIDNGWKDTPTVRYCLHDMEGSNKVDQPATEFPPVGTEYKRLYLNGLTRQLQNEAPATDTPAFYLCESDAPKASFYLTVNEETNFIGYPKAHLFVEADGSDDMDLFLIVQKLDRQFNVLRQFTIPSLSPRTHDMLENHGGVAKYSGAYGRLRVSHRHLDKAQSTDIIPVLAFDREEKLSKGEIVEIEVPLAPTGLTLYPGETLRFMVSSQNITGNVHPGVPAYVSPDNHGRHIIHCGGEYQSYLQIGVLK